MPGDNHNRTRLDVPYPDDPDVCYTELNLVFELNIYLLYLESLE